MPPVPSTRPSVKITHLISRNTGTILTSNRYYFSKDSGDPTFFEWNEIIDSLVSNLRAALDDNHTFVRADCYVAGHEAVVQTRDLSGDGTATWTGPHVPSDCAAVVRFRTDGRTSRNHPIYLFKYYHSVRAIANDNIDTLAPSVVDSLDTFASWLVAGNISDGVVTYAICGPHGDIARDSHVLPEVRHRDFPR